MSVTIIDAKELLFDDLNNQVRAAQGDVRIENCIGQRFIAAGRKQGNIYIVGTPGNALGAYLNGATVTVEGNAQDATGDTMNKGRIVIDGHAGDALGYAMRGGEIYVRGGSGYRTGIHMKQYKDLRPIVVVGEATGSFPGEYLAGGLIIILNIEGVDIPFGSFAGTGMHGGKIVARAKRLPQDLPRQVAANPATDADLAEIAEYVKAFEGYFNVKVPTDFGFFTLTPNAKNPYTQMYTHN
ncbi:hypothetical protein FACS1894217_01690 [Clostridia bacterium]|nr:hypothetical protein FACS1894217_01690 [Clostridia bacterium]